MPMKYLRPGDMDDQQYKDEYPPHEPPQDKRDGCGRIIAIWLITFGTLIAAALILA